MFIIAPERTRRAGSFAKIIWINLASPTGYLQSNLETDLDQQTESLTTFLPKKTQHQKWENLLFFNDLAVPELWECWTLGITTYLFWWGGTSCQRSFARGYLVTNGWQSGMVWSGRRDRIHWCLQPLWLEKQTESPDGSWSILFRHLFEPSARRSLASLCLSRNLLLQTPKGRDRLYASKEELQRVVLEQVLPEDEAVLWMDKALLDVVKEIPKERLAYCASDAHDLDEIKEQVSQILLVEDGLLSEKKDGITALSGLVNVEQESFQPEALVMTASRGRRLIYPGPSIPTSDLSHCCFDGYGSEIDRLSDSLQCAPLSRDFAGQIWGLVIQLLYLSGLQPRRRSMEQ